MKRGNRCGGGEHVDCELFPCRVTIIVSELILHAYCSYECDNNDQILTQSLSISNRIASLVATGSAGGAYYSGSYDRCVRTVEGGEVVRTFQAGPKPVKALVRVPGLGLVTGDGDGRVALWSPEAVAGAEAPATRAATLQAGGEEVAALAFSPVSGLVAAGGWAKGIRLWASEAVERAQEAAAEAPEVSKKRRGTKGAAADAVVETEVETQAVLTGHSGAVSALDWTAEGAFLKGVIDVWLWGGVLSIEVSPHILMHVSYSMVEE